MTDPIERTIRSLVEMSYQYSEDVFDEACDAVNDEIAEDQTSVERWIDAMTSGIRHAHTEAREVAGARRTVIRIATPTFIVTHVVDPASLDDEQREQIVAHVRRALSVACSGGGT